MASALLVLGLDFIDPGIDDVDTIVATSVVVRVVVEAEEIPGGVGIRVGVEGEVGGL